MLGLLKLKSQLIFSALLQITQDNTKLLEEVARLTELKMQIANELNAPAKAIAPPSALDDAKEKEERNRIKAYVKFQATELESLRAELNMLKRKEAPIFSYTAPPMPPDLLKRTSNDDLQLPPINHRR
jgi:hypothetical protein